ncbi:uncharacterized protein LOC131613624 [Vicia villosa]|uniref:uncharacterized protein LOC131613624 n=1 Tax=Vicia villosa TaxID=3911 RepID=UPI00273C23D1|nr:uncharacterized protein LOC131613624 [Vicia villosa]
MVIDWRNFSWYLLTSSIIMVLRFVFAITHNLERRRGDSRRSCHNFTGLAKVAPGLILKSPLEASTSYSASSQTSEQADKTASQDSNSDIGAKNPPPKSGRVSSSASMPTGNNSTSAFINVSGHNLSRSLAAELLENSIVNQSASTREEDINNFPSRRRYGSPFLNQNDAGQLRGRTEIAPDQRKKFLQKFQEV